jgi:hypothetical protein
VADAANLVGRIFFTATERDALERGYRPQPAPPTPSAPPASTPALPPPRFDGALWRNGQLVMIWLDHTPTAPAAIPAIQLVDSGIVIRRNGIDEPLPPGQNLPPPP